ncbi:MAG: coproporphyrinogen III oxidase [Sulfurimonas sp.]|nr:MAG: coproporphyrinogen III oxidase [Sulfurimonas sp.]
MNKIVWSQSEASMTAYALVEELQHYFVEKLDTISREFGENIPAQALQWSRDKGSHGGGIRLEMQDDTIFNRGSVNISQVHYDDHPKKNLEAASAISTIIHPLNPYAPSMHMHISWTQMRRGGSYWRMMADINPSVENAAHTQSFTRMLQKVSGTYYAEATAQGDRYFYIPALKRHRGVRHFYLEQFNSGSFQNDTLLAQQLGTAVIDTYCHLLRESIQYTYGEDERVRQRHYHTLYFFQVLTLDRGTTSGLLVHNENDIGILASLPKYIDADLLLSWQDLVKKPQDALLKRLVMCLGSGIVLVDEAMKKGLAEAVRSHYRQYPEALHLQASGDVIAPTVQNHA